MNAVAEKQHIDECQLNDLLNEILREWHSWSANDSVGRGFGRHSASCRVGPGGTTSWEVADMETVDAVIDTIPQPHRTALAFQARNLNSRAEVWKSPRLPENWEERQILLMEARNMLTRGLIGKGVL